MPDPKERFILPLDKDVLEKWRGDLSKSREIRKKIQKWADANLKAYAPSPDDDPEHYGQVLNTNRDFTLVERKKADLFYQRPDVSAIPSPLLEGHEELLDTHTAILNEKLGVDGVNAKILVHQVLFDILCPTGKGWTVMGYESTTVDVPTPDPNFQPPMIVDPMTGQPAPDLSVQAPIVMSPVPVYEDCFWHWLSPYQALTPHDVRTVLTDEWPWVGYDFEMPVRTAKRKGWVPETFNGSAPATDLHYDHVAAASSGDAVVKGSILYYKSALYRDDRVHPLHQTLLVLIDGLDQPAEHKDSPYQTIDGKGALTPDSLIGFPIHTFVTRLLTDSPHPPSDATITRPTVNEINKTRGQQLEYRDANILRWMYNVDTLPTDALAKIVRSPVGGMIGVPGEAFVGDGAIKELPRGTYPRDNLELNDRLDNDLARSWALDENQIGVAAGGDGTATEAQITQGNANARAGFERGNILDAYCKGVTKYSTLIQRFLTVQQAATIVGQEKAAAWDSWRKIIPAALAFTALPDATLRTDLASEKKRAMDEYTFFANDPYINRKELLRQLMPRLRYNTAKLLIDPPAKGPEPIKFSLTIASASLNPMLPEYANLYQILTQQGVQNLVQPIAEAILNQPPAPGAGPQTEHGGKVAQMEGLSKHATDLSGGMQGTGSPAPMGAGGGSGVM